MWISGLLLVDSVEKPVEGYYFNLFYVYTFVDKKRTGSV
jgi:hypothetical protein